MKIILEFTFTGRDIPRSKLLKQFLSSVFPIVGEEHKAFLAMILEMVKNIYDHADGWGYAKFHKLPDGEIHFEVNNLKGDNSAKSGRDKTQTEHIKNTKNFGVGIAAIKAIAKSLHILLISHKADKFEYQGIYRPSSDALD